MSIIKNIYRTLVPESLRWKIINAKKAKQHNVVKTEILNYYKQNPTSDSEILEALTYLKENDLSVFPYIFFNKYKTENIKVYINETNQLPYLKHNGKNLYFKKSWTNEHIVDAYRFLLAEQDSLSPHCYLTPTYQIKSNGIVVDVGAAEGIFAIDEIENIKHIYLIETDNEWIEALNETFKPWKDKITIINKFISNRNDDKNMTLDSYFSNIEIDFLKIDVDGAEEELLKGAENVVNNKVSQLAICTYHKTHDNRDFSKLLLDKKYKIENSNGYMLFYFDSNFEKPFFRRGLIRAIKQ
jgi:hypothetical protein